jgi:hypothetical protein
MSAAHAASLTAALLVTKGNAQPSRGLAQPMSARVDLGARNAGMFEPGPVIRHAPPILVPPPPDPNAAQSRITLRVDAPQRLRLRLACAHLGKSRQTILLDALDHYLQRVLPAFLHDACPCIQGGAATGNDCCSRTED